ncbi:MAG: PQQ-binding-like beta-propeller repeat protein, partial [Gemmataceae bacterium]
MRMRILLAAITIPVALASPILAQDWTTYRGDPQRSGNPGGKPGPSTPRVLWTFKAKEHFIAAPVPTSQGLLVSGLSFINSSVLYHLDTDPKAEKRVLWQKSSPLLELPTVSSPLVRDGEVIFGDGMHQTNGASLQALDLPAGSPRWQLRVDGTLVHLEGAPTLAQGRIYLGGGAAGVLCVDPNRLTLEGKEGSPAEMIKILKQKWTDLQNDFEEKRKKKDPLALPPRDSDLPRPTPALVWNRGKNDWHVDAPLAVVEGKVLVATAFLDKEMVGKRALICLDTATGKELWQTALSVNPWGGPSVQGKTVVVTGSTIGY